MVGMQQVLEQDEDEAISQILGTNEQEELIETPSEFIRINPNSFKISNHQNEVDNRN